MFCSGCLGVAKVKNTENSDFSANSTFPEWQSLSPGKPHQRKIALLEIVDSIAGPHSRSNLPNASPVLLAVDEGGLAQLWKMPAGIPRVLWDFNAKIEAMTFCKNYNLLAIANPEVGVYRFQSPSGLPSAEPEKIASLKRLSSRVRMMECDSSGQSLLIGAVDGNVYRWDFSKDLLAENSSTAGQEYGKTLERYLGTGSSIEQVLFHPFGRVVFSSNMRGVIRAILRYDSGNFGTQFAENLFGPRYFSSTTAVRDFPATSALPATKIKLDPKAELLIAARSDGTLEVWKLRGTKLIQTLPAHKGLIYDLTFDAAGRLVTVGRDNRLCIWSLEAKEDGNPNLALLKQLEVADARIVVALEDGTIVVGNDSGVLLAVYFKKLSND